MADDRNVGLEKLIVWQRALAFAERIHQTVIQALPPEEKWVMANQLRRSAQSIPANIAEGYGRFYYQETIRFCYLARGSLEETYSHLCLALRLQYLVQEEYVALEKEIEDLRKMLSGYIAFLKRTKRGAGEPGSALAIRDEGGVYQSDESVGNEANLQTEVPEGSIPSRESD